MTSAQVTAAATTVIALALVALGVIALLAALDARKTSRKINALVGRLHGDLAPAIRYATSIVDNINYITRSLRHDVRLINRTVSSANDRVQEAVAATERRLNEFSALMSVVQDEAEDLFISTAATVKGVQTGAARLRNRGGMDLASDELDGEGHPDIESEEELHGDDSAPDGSAETFPAPRVRPRARGGQRP